MHTVIRIPAGAALAAGVFGDSPPAWTLAAAIVGGTLAAGSHFTKAGTRAVINTSPEPVSNWAASFGEDLFAGGLVYLALAYPLVALAVVAIGCGNLDLAAAEAVAIHPRHHRTHRALVRNASAGHGPGSARNERRDV